MKMEPDVLKYFLATILMSGIFKFAVNVLFLYYYFFIELTYFM